MFGAQHDKLCYSIGDAAALLSVGRRTLYREISAGRIATAKMGKRTLVPAEALGYCATASDAWRCPTYLHAHQCTAWRLDRMSAGALPQAACAPAQCRGP